MPKFKITETRLAETVWTYEIEAENEQEAIEMIYTDQVTFTHHEIKDFGEDSQFDVTEI